MPTTLVADQVKPLKLQFKEYMVPGDAIDIDFKILTDPDDPASFMDLTGTRWHCAITVLTDKTTLVVEKDTDDGAGEFDVDIPNKHAELRLRDSDMGALEPNTYHILVRTRLTDSRDLTIGEGEFTLNPKAGAFD